MIEEALAKHPAVAFVGAIGQPDIYSGEIPCAYVELKKDAAADPAELQAFAELNDTDLNSYQALVDVFQKEGVLQSRIDVRDKILKPTDFGS